MKPIRPKIKVERTGVDTLLEITALVLTATPIPYLILNRGADPELMILAAVMIFEFLMFTVIQRFPHTFNYLVRITEENAEAQYRIAVSMMGWMNLILSAGLALMFFGIASLTAAEWDKLSVWIMLPFMGSLFGALAYFMLKSWRCR